MPSGLSVCIPAHNEARTIYNTLESLVNQKGISKQPHIYVCTNACNDGTQEVVASFSQKHHIVTLLDTQKKGKAHAWNLLFKAADTSIVAFADADTVAHELALHNLSNSLDSREYDIAGARIIPYTSDLPLSSRIVTALVASTSRLQVGLSGALYACHKERLKECLREKGFDAMPENLIADDHWLRLVAGERLIINHDAIVYYRPFALTESLKVVRRHFDGVQQIRDLYPGLVSKRRSFFAERTYGVYKRMLSTPGTFNKVSFVAGCAFRFSLKYLSKHLLPQEPRNGEYNWYVSNASKIPIPLSLATSGMTK